MQAFTVLIVDDEPLIVEVLAGCAEDCGLLPTTASDGDEALELLASGMRFDSLITDIKMPGAMSGWELARQARAA